MPTEAGTHATLRKQTDADVIPACAGMTSARNANSPSRTP
jgi:hypothetical protein